MRIGPLELSWSRSKPLAGSGASPSSPLVTAQAAPIPPQLYPRNKHAYIYALSDPRTKAVRYIGKTFDPSGRYSKHCRANGKTHKDCWIKQLRAAGIAPEFDVIDILSAKDERAFQAAEAKWIETFRSMGFKLTNLMDGGGSGGRHAPETIERMRLAQNNRSDETKAKIAAAGLARRGRKHKPESIAKMKASHAFVSEETRIKASVSHSNISDDSRRRMSEGQKLRYQDPRQRAKMAEILAKVRGGRRTPEQRARISAGIKAAIASRPKEKSEAIRLARVGKPIHSPKLGPR